jgi:hypothetical protein
MPELAGLDRRNRPAPAAGSEAIHAPPGPRSLISFAQQTLHCQSLTPHPRRTPIATAVLVFGSSMRRAPANLVLTILLWSYLAPVFLVTTELDLPACCRSHGKHHGCTCCMGRHDADGASGFHANSPQCPCRLLGSVIHRAVAAEVRKVFSIQPPSSDLLAPTEAASNVFRDRIRNSGRGPPILPL